MLKTTGAAGTSGLDQEGWKRSLTSNQFGNISNNLCKIFAEVVRKFCTTKDPSSSTRMLYFDQLELAGFCTKYLVKWLYHTFGKI